MNPVQIQNKGNYLWTKIHKPSLVEKLDKRVGLSKQDCYTKKLTTIHFMKPMLFVQLYETEILRAIGDALF